MVLKVFSILVILVALCCAIPVNAVYDTNCRTSQFVNETDGENESKLRFDLKENSITIVAGEGRFGLHILGIAGENTVEYSIEDETIAMIDYAKSEKVVVRGIKEGKTTLTAQSSDGQIVELEIVVISYPDLVTISKMGDANGDYVVDAADAQSTLCFYAEILAGNPHQWSLQTKAADVNADGKIDSTDAQLILLYYVQNTLADKPTTWEELLAQK